MKSGFTALGGFFTGKKGKKGALGYVGLLAGTTHRVSGSNQGLWKITGFFNRELKMPKAPFTAPVAGADGYDQAVAYIKSHDMSPRSVEPWMYFLLTLPNDDARAEMLNKLLENRVFSAKTIDQLWTDVTHFTQDPAFQSMIHSIPNMTPDAWSQLLGEAYSTKQKGLLFFIQDQIGQAQANNANLLARISGIADKVGMAWPIVKGFLKNL